VHEVAQHVQVHEQAQDVVPKPQEVLALQEQDQAWGWRCLPVREGRLGQRRGEEGKGWKRF